MWPVLSMSKRLVVCMLTVLYNFVRVAVRFSSSPSSCFIYTCSFFLFVFFFIFQQGTTLALVGILYIMAFSIKSFYHVLQYYLCVYIIIYYMQAVKNFLFFCTGIFKRKGRNLAFHGIFDSWIFKTSFVGLWYRKMQIWPWAWFSKLVHIFLWYYSISGFRCAPNFYSLLAYR